MKATAGARVTVAILALGWVTACSKPATTSGEKRPAPEPGSYAERASPSPSEADKTRELQEKAAGYEDRFKEIQNSDLSADQKAQAAGELVDEQQRTVRDAQDGPAGEAPADPQQ